MAGASRAFGKPYPAYPDDNLSLAGSGTISSASNAVVQKEGVPFAGTVIIREKFSRLEVGATRSASDGTWSFSGLSTDKFFRAEVEDKTQLLNGAVSDWMKPT